MHKSEAWDILLLWGPLAFAQFWGGVYFLSGNQSAAALALVWMGIWLVRGISEWSERRRWKA